MTQPNPRQRPNNPQQRRRPANSAARRKRARKKKIISFAVFALLLLVLLLVAILISGGFGAPQSSSSIPLPVSEPVPVVKVEPPAPSKPARTPTPYDEEGIPPLFNFDNAIPKEYLDAMELENTGGGQQMEKRAAEAFKAMSAAAAEDGVTLAQVSGYRTNAHQTSNYNASIQRYLEQGLTREKAVELTEGYYAIPGTSEHEAGLAMDIGFIQDSFEETPEFEWLQKHAVEYGFILRYRADTFETTRIHYEPWHYRYIGANHAEIYHEKGYTSLEDYLAKEFPMG